MQHTIFVGANMGIEKLSFAEMKKKIKEHVEFKEKTGAIDMPTTALFILDAMTGEVKEFKKGYISTF